VPHAASQSFCRVANPSFPNIQAIQRATSSKGAKEQSRQQKAARVLTRAVGTAPRAGKELEVGHGERQNKQARCRFCQHLTALGRDVQALAENLPTAIKQLHSTSAGRRGETACQCLETPFCSPQNQHWRHLARVQTRKCLLAGTHQTQNRYWNCTSRFFGSVLGSGS
jgi:hypothetical protein